MITFHNIEDFQSLTAKENSELINVKIENNKISANNSSGREFSARFVKLKCDIGSGILNGSKGLLINEELFYILQGD